MKTLMVVLGTIVLAIALLVAGAWAGTVWAQGRWGSNMMRSSSWGNGMMGYGTTPYGYGMMGSSGSAPIGMGPGMMGSNWNWNDMPCGQGYVNPGEGDVSSLEDVETAVQGYAERLGYRGLEVHEVMEFERNYYAILAEEDTGIGAMEVLVDKSTGAVGPEPGPNMMWNAKYGMHGQGGGMMGMMGGYASGAMTLSPEEAQDVAQRWLDANLPGRVAGEADEFYGYYTLHFLNDGQIEGMLSVHGSSGDVWYHGWHGDFVAMAEGHG
jgi:hypothetical protein